jgi:hydroxypyruvate isomerase
VKRGPFYTFRDTGGTSMRRREFLAAAAAIPALGFAQAPFTPRTGRLKQALFRSAFDQKMSFDDMCREAVRLGAHGFDAVDLSLWPTMRRYGLVPTIAPPDITPAPFKDGVARKELRAQMEPAMHAFIDVCAREGCKTIPALGGQRQGMSYEEGADNAVAFFNGIKAHAEDRRVTVCIEVMNRYDRPDQVCDRLAWARQVLERVNSPYVKLLFDIYHVQIQDGDICRNLRDHKDLIAHIHTAGVPGRHEIDETQELNYRFIAQTIAELGYTGYVAHEYTPAPGRDPLVSLRRTLEIMNV